MAPQHKRSYSEEESAVQNALQYLQDNPGTKIIDAARETGAIYKRVWRRQQGTQSKKELSNHTKLTKEEEQQIKDKIDHLDELSMRATRPILTGLSNSVLKLRTHPPASTPKVVRDWSTRFQDRFSDEYIWKKQKPLNANRNRITPEIIVDHIEKLGRVVAKYGIAAEDKWNFDQTGFRIGCGGSCDVITSIRYKNHKLYMADPENRVHLTSIECCNAVGVMIPPMLVYKGETILQADVQPTMPGDWKHTSSPTGYANDEIMLAWIQHFEEHTRRLRKGRYRLLIFDGFESHTDFPFIRWCELHDIIPYVLPSHSTHLLQPLDVGCFQPLKHSHGQAIANAVRVGADTYTRQDFLYDLRDIRKAAFKEKTIVSAWKKSGCHPASAQVILDALPSS